MWLRQLFPERDVNLKLRRQIGTELVRMPRCLKVDPARCGIGVLTDGNKPQPTDLMVDNAPEGRRSNRGAAMGDQRSRPAGGPGAASPTVVRTLSCGGRAIVRRRLHGFDRLHCRECLWPPSPTGERLAERQADWVASYQTLAILPSSRSTSEGLGSITLAHFCYCPCH